MKKIGIVVGAVSLTLLGLFDTGLLMVNNVKDVAVGSNTTYCGYIVQSNQITFYCQSGE